MIPRTCIVIETDKFPVLQGEDDEIANERMYGKALCNYLQSNLPSAGIEAPFFCNEDWGWWLEVKRTGFQMALCIYSDPEALGDPKRYALLPSIQRAKQWSWAKFKSIDVSKDVLAIMDVVEAVFRRDHEIELVERRDEFPF